MVYGTVPFKAAQMEDLHKSILEGKYVLKENVSEEVRDLIYHLLDVNPKTRYGFKEISRHVWFSSLDNNSIIYKLLFLQEAKRRKFKRNFQVKQR